MDNQWQPISVTENKHIGERRVNQGAIPPFIYRFYLLRLKISCYGISGGVGLAIVFLHCVHVTAKWFFGDKNEEDFYLWELASGAGDL